MLQTALKAMYWSMLVSIMPAAASDSDIVVVAPQRSSQSHLAPDPQVYDWDETAGGQAAEYSLEAALGLYDLQHFELHWDKGPGGRDTKAIVGWNDKAVSRLTELKGCGPWIEQPSFTHVLIVLCKQFLLLAMLVLAGCCCLQGHRQLGQHQGGLAGLVAMPLSSMHNTACWHVTARSPRQPPDASCKLQVWRTAWPENAGRWLFGP
jgi:hypothetical protein